VKAVATTANKELWDVAVVLGKAQSEEARSRGMDLPYETWHVEIIGSILKPNPTVTNG
jgi:hypothetical protein